MAIGSNVIQFRIVRKWNEPAAVNLNDIRVQVRTRDVVIGVLGTSLGDWTAWQDIDSAPVVDIVSAP